MLLIKILSPFSGTQNQSRYEQIMVLADKRTDNQWPFCLLEYSTDKKINVFGCCITSCCFLSISRHEHHIFKTLCEATKDALIKSFSRHFVFNMALD